MTGTPELFVTASRHEPRRYCWPPPCWPPPCWPPPCWPRPCWPPRCWPPPFFPLLRRLCFCPVVLTLPWWCPLPLPPLDIVDHSTSANRVGRSAVAGAHVRTRAALP